MKNPNTGLLTPREVATHLNVKEATLAVWRSSGRYVLPFIKVGSRVMYRLSDVESFLISRTHQHTGV